MRTDRDMTLSLAEKMQHQEPFKRVAPLLDAALLLGAGGGFALATVLTLAQLLQNKQSGRVCWKVWECC
jgi:hypothetical protein